MIPRASLESFASEVVRRFSPEKIVLFGSQRKGGSTADSDADLLLIMNFEGRRARKAAEILHQTDPSFPVDLILRTPEEIVRRLELHDEFISEILSTGEVLYDRARR